MDNKGFNVFDSGSSKWDDSEKPSTNINFGVNSKTVFARDEKGNRIAEGLVDVILPFSDGAKND